ncbi:SDR family oxidoreductase [Clostridium sardiniense]|uniref:SDR family oxidoreductase n=1 Tax=Clostridium sardiniense TaxID=29369 RepID=UPI0019596A08|nr:sugar nucleotide-binding protein [Clostridium sardiniense]MBM7835317.1 dTDP-4-dehydrorhamnose reductase [Clostridium sardiniense]
MKKILVTGSNGFLSSRFIETYKDKYEVIKGSHNFLDITDENKVFNFFKNNKIDIVFHSAAISDTAICEKDPSLCEKVNFRGTVNIAKGCSLNNSTLVFASSDQIYNGNLEKGPYTEETIPYPNNVYGVSKLKAEKSIKEILDSHYNLRLTWLFSLPEKNKKTNKNILYNILNSIIKNDPIAFSPNEFRGISYAYDVIENFEKLLESPYGDYNFGSENNLSTYDVALKVLEFLNIKHREGSLLIKDSERFKDEDRDLRISNEKLRNNSIYFSSTEESIYKCLKDFNII